MSNIKLQSSTLIGFDILLENIILLNSRYFCSSAYVKNCFLWIGNLMINAILVWIENKTDNLHFFDRSSYVSVFVSIYCPHLIYFYIYFQDFKSSVYIIRDINLCLRKILKILTRIQSKHSVHCFCSHILISTLWEYWRLVRCILFPHKEVPLIRSSVV